MRLRHFSSGLLPVPVDTAISGSYFNEACSQLSRLAQAAGLGACSKDEPIDALSLAMGKTAQKAVPKELDISQWMPDVSNDNSFFEYSVAVDHKTGNAEHRFLIEAQPESPGLKDNIMKSLQESALQLNKWVADTYTQSITLERMNTLQDIFMPLRAEGRFGAWHSCVMSDKGTEWKIYLNPSASGSNTARSATKTAFLRLGLSSSWKLVTRSLGTSDIIQYFSLDLSPDPKNARIKVYVAHPNASASAIAEKHVRICPDACAYSIQQFCATMAGGSLGLYQAKPVLSCFAFTTEAQEHPVGTVHCPVVAYAENDLAIKQRVEAYINAAELSPKIRKRYKKVIRAVQRWPMDLGRGILAWISLKIGEGGKRATTFYFSPELFGRLA